MTGMNENQRRDLPLEWQRHTQESGPWGKFRSSGWALLFSLVTASFVVGGFALIVLGVMQRSLWLSALGVWATAGVPGLVSVLMSKDRYKSNDN